MTGFSNNSIAHIITFEDRYAIDARLLGRSIRISVSDDVVFSITIPSVVFKNGDFKIEIPGALEKFKTNIEDWGDVKSYDDNRIDNLDKLDVWISAVLVECFCKDSARLPNYSNIQVEAKKVLHALQVINPDAIRIPSDENKDNLCNVVASVSIDENGKAQPLIILPMIYDGRKGTLSISDIKRAFQNAHYSISAPYEMLDNARINLTHDDTRAAVLNCATAIEVTLKRLVSTYIKDNNLPQPLIDYAAKHSDGFVKLNDTCKKLGINLEGLPNVRETVMGIRNRVIHGGYIPSNKQSQVAYGKTRMALRVLNVPMFE